MGNWGCMCVLCVVRVLCVCALCVLCVRGMSTKRGVRHTLRKEEEQHTLIIHWSQTQKLSFWIDISAFCLVWLLLLDRILCGYRPLVAHELTTHHVVVQGEKERALSEKEGGTADFAWVTRVMWVRTTQKRSLHFGLLLSTKGMSIRSRWGGSLNNKDILRFGWTKYWKQTPTNPLGEVLRGCSLLGVHRTTMGETNSTISWIRGKRKWAG